ncbi:MAG: hypothetical protein IJU79_01445 [Desulfovibrionaceae bacterium]|nr:hypothetical protein [Desulfovibrionaceae bacterium]
MHYFLRIVISLLLVFCFALTCVADAKPIRIAYLEGGSLGEYQRNLVGIIYELNNLELLNLDLPLNQVLFGPQNTFNAQVWDELQRHSHKSQVALAVDGYYSANWNSQERSRLIRQIQERLDQAQDIDVLIAMGTWAGQDVLKLDTKIPIIICDVSDPLGAGIISHITKHNKKNIICIVEPGLYQRHLQIFHDIFKFKRLGITFENTPTGRSMAGYDAIVAKAGELDIEIVTCPDAAYTAPISAMFERRQSCNKLFIKKNVDAIYITYDFDVLGYANQQALLKPLIRAGIPTMTQIGAVDVERGILVGFADTSREEGKFTAHLLRDIYADHALETLARTFVRPLNLAINLTTATRMGWNPPLSFLLIVKQIFH